MPAILPNTLAEVARLETLVDLASVLPVEHVIAAVGPVRAVFQLMQDFAWETAITSVEGVLALGAFNLLVSLLLALWVATALQHATFMQNLSILKTSGARDFVFGPHPLAAAAVATTSSKGIA